MNFAGDRSDKVRHNSKVQSEAYQPFRGVRFRVYDAVGNVSFLRPLEPKPVGAALSISSEGEAEYKMNHFSCIKYLRLILPQDPRTHRPSFLILDTRQDLS